MDVHSTKADLLGSFAAMCTFADDEMDSSWFSP